MVILVIKVLMEIVVEVVFAARSLGPGGPAPRSRVSSFGKISAGKKQFPRSLPLLATVFGTEEPINCKQAVKGNFRHKD